MTNLIKQAVESAANGNQPMGGMGSVVEDAVEKIRRIIIDARIEPGQRLVLSRLAAETQISVMPIREALRKLEGEGLVDFHPNKGAMVRSIDKKFLTDLYEVRAVLHEFALRVAVQKMTFAKAERLRELCRVFDNFIEDGELAEVVEANRNIHLFIFEIAENMHALRLFVRDWEIVLTLRLKFGYRPGRLQEISNEQHALVEAMINGDLNSALSIMKMHNIAGLEDLIVNF